jgi:3,4-dihydroxyphenylacetate 2,3-dioxygenase
MGSIVGAALVSHVPPLVLPEDIRNAIYGPEGTTLLDGLHRLRAEQLDAVEADTIVVFDTHWFTTVEHVVASHDERTGKYTSEELPRGMRQMPYSIRGDRELAETWEAVARADGCPVTSIDDDYLPIHYPTVNLLPFLQKNEAWVSASVVQTGTPADWLRAGRHLADAIAQLDRRVVLLASGGLSHKFWPLQEFGDHESASLDNIRSPEARSADERVIDLLQRGHHADVLAFWPAFRAFSPEGFFAHYLLMLGALGGPDCTAPGIAYSAYESTAGTGQIHLWFSPPWQ